MLAVSLALSGCGGCVSDDQPSSSKDPATGSSSQHLTGKVKPMPGNQTTPENLKPRAYLSDGATEGGSGP